MISPSRRRWIGGLLAALPLLLLGLAACARDPRPGPESGGGSTRLDETHWFGTPVTVRNVTLWPIHGEDASELGEVLSLQEAQRRGLAEVREHGAGSQGAASQQAASAQQIELPTEANAQLSFPDEPQRAQTRQLVQGGGGPSVGSLVVENKSEYSILICGGTIVKGGNQDRQIGTDLVVPPKTTLAVDAFCVEQGRWTAERQGENTSGEFLALPALTPKQVRAPAVYEKDQSAVWSNVAHTNASLGKTAATSTLLASVEELNDDERAFRAEVCARIEQALAKKDAVGFAYAVNGAPQGVRLFAHSGLLEQHRAGFASTVALEADLARRTEPDSTRSAKLEEILALVRAVEAAPEQVETTAGRNVNGLKGCDAGNASACYVEVDAPEGQKRVSVSREWMAK